MQTSVEKPGKEPKSFLTSARVSLNIDLIQNWLQRVDSVIKAANGYNEDIDKNIFKHTRVNFESTMTYYINKSKEPSNLSTKVPYKSTDWPRSEKGNFLKLINRWGIPRNNALLAFISRKCPCKTWHVQFTL